LVECRKLECDATILNTDNNEKAVESDIILKFRTNTSDEIIYQSFTSRWSSL